MTLAKTTEIPKIEVVNNWNIQVATDTVIKEDGVELSRSRHRHVLTPFQSNMIMKIASGYTLKQI